MDLVWFTIHTDTPKLQLLLLNPILLKEEKEILPAYLCPNFKIKMTEENIKKKKEEKQIKSLLNASEKEKQLEGIKLSRVHATTDTFNQMLNLLKKTDEPEVEAAIIQFLYDLKDERSIESLINALNNEEMSYYHSFIISAFWQSAIDGSPYLDLFVKKAIEGEYMSSLEALTVVENFDSSFPADLLMECEADLVEAIENEEQEEKRNLLISLKEVVAKLPEEGE